ncbi:MAG: amidohydrolase [Myxococcales bacterium]|nr:amidohydrolase [Myxococcales bacterium]
MTPSLQEVFEQIRQQIEIDTPKIVTLRHCLHQYPELSHKEVETTRRVEEALADLDVQVRRGATGVGLIVDLGPKNQPRVMIRGDMDALAIEEETGLPFESVHQGVMHACGHDVHTASVFGALRVLAKCAPHRAFRFIFQHAEEVTPGGAAELIKEGALQDVAAAISMHCDPSRPVGKVGLQAGPLTASNDQFWVEVYGAGGHGARPHETQDTVLATAQIIQAIYHAFDRSVDARHPFVVSVGVIHGGDQSPNVLPTKVRFGGSIRSAHKEARMRIESILQRTLDGMSLALGVRTKLEMRFGAPGVHNDPMVVEVFREAVSSLLGDDAIEAIGLPSMGGEDFAFFAEKVPSAMLRIGTGLSTALHTPTFVADDEAVPLSSQILARTAMLLSERLP